MFAHIFPREEDVKVNYCRREIREETNGDGSLVGGGKQSGNVEIFGSVCILRWDESRE